ADASRHEENVHQSWTSPHRLALIPIAETDLFRRFQYLTVPLHLTAEDARAALEKAGWFTGREVTW
ncbi:MAG: hypothetical protein ACRDOH_11390, partial [Streptosporangiaceae bacterium]